MLSERYNAKEQEPNIRKFWDENKIFKFDELSKKEVYSIDTPPPSVSGSLHMGHVFSYTQTEIMARIKRMQGYNVFYPLGFDNNGMPTERLVEKLYNKKSKEYSREEFNNLCVKTMEEYQELYKNLYNRLGFSFDYDYTYSTIGSDAQKISQQEFIKNYKEGHIFYSNLPSTFCPECQTAVAQADLESVEKPTIFNYLNFEIVDSNEKLPIATTRPEMLAACVCVFVNPEDERFKKFIGHEVVVPLYNKRVKILADDKAAIDKGTGVVMCCTYGDQTDYFWQVKHNLPVITIINTNGTLNELAGKYAGMHVAKARKAIIEDLKAEGYAYKQDEITHTVSVHDRCGASVEIIPKKQWSIKILDKKDVFIERANEISWFPEQMKSRHNNWVLNIDRDWNISRQRYFGVSFPVWHCADCGEIILAEAEELPINPLEVKKNQCPRCGNANIYGDPDVMDTWATSSISPLLATYKIKNEQLKKSIHPMSMRPNAHDIIRTWDFYTIVRSEYHKNNIPWKNVVVSGHILAAPGSKLSKSKNDKKLDPNELIEMYSADIVRYWTASSTLGIDTVFGEEQFKNGGKLVNKLFNASRFVTSMLSNFNKNEKVELSSFDKGYIEKFYAMLKRFNFYQKRYEIGLALNELERFFWNFCDDYIEVAKNKLYRPEEFGEEATKSGRFASYKMLYGMLRLFAPYLPFITEEIYQGFFKQNENLLSIHLTNFPNEQETVDEELVLQVEEFCGMLSWFRKFKSSKNMSMKTEIENAFLKTKNVKFFKENITDFKATLNIKNLEITQGEALAGVRE